MEHMSATFAQHALAFAATLLTAAPALAAPPEVRVEITSRATAFEGKVFGEHGDYEQIKGVVRFAIDPLAPENRGIVDLRQAPRDAAGMVRYEADFAILRPRMAARGRRVMVYDVVNRGNRLILSLNGGTADNGFLMRQGYTLVWSGWQGDITGANAIAARLPIATDHDRPLTGRISAEANIDSPQGGHITLAYPAATQDPAQARLTVRARADDPEQIVPPGRWQWEDDSHVRVSPPPGMDAGAIYRFSYEARDPRVMGLGFAGVRDLLAFLRHASAQQGNPLADLAAAPCERTAAGACNTAQGAFDTVIGYGASQSGRFLRDFVYQGFNRASDGSRVFDGVFALIPGARRTFTNARFAEPGRFSRQHEDHDVPGFDFPFTYGAVTDPVTGRRDSLLARCTQTRTCPRLFHVDTSAEFWQAGSSLIGTGGTARDVPLPRGVRAYLIAGGSHMPGLAMSYCRYPANGLDYQPILRALLVRLVDWTAHRRTPPDSRWPSLAQGDLRSLDALAPPDLGGAGLEWPKVVNRPLAPAGKRGWPVQVPRVDADGNDISGIHAPDLSAPLGTYLGWNVRKPGFAAGDLCNLAGSYVPFARTEVERGGDPRPSLERRYSDGSRQPRMAAAIAALQGQGFLLAEDAEALAVPAGPRQDRKPSR